MTHLLALTEQGQSSSRPRQCPKYNIAIERENVILIVVWCPCVKMLAMYCLFMVCDGEIRSYGERRGLGERGGGGARRGWGLVQENVNEASSTTDKLTVTTE